MDCLCSCVCNRLKSLSNVRISSRDVLISRYGHRWAPRSVLEWLWRW